jgi:hypothetical protein
MILIIGLSRDPTIVHTLKAAAYLGVPFRFFDLSRFRESGWFSWDFKGRAGTFGYDDHAISLPDAKISGIYLRFIDRLPRAQKRYAAMRLHALRRIMTNVRTFTVNPLSHDISNSTKLYHLSLLHDAGFLTPRTIVTNELSAALEFHRETPECIYKGVSSQKTFAEAYGPPVEPRLAWLANCPVLFQERIRGADVRAHLIGNRVEAELIESDGVDYRLSTSGPKYFKQTELPSEVVCCCQRYAKENGLTFLGFDFKVDNSGRYFVLEANPMPGYDAYDRRACLRISRALFDILLDPQPVEARARGVHATEQS